MNIRNKIIEYKKKQKRIEIIQELYKIDPLDIKVNNVELSVEKSNTIKVTVTFNNNKKSSFLYSKYASSERYKQLIDLI